MERGESLAAGVRDTVSLVTPPGMIVAPNHVQLASGLFVRVLFVRHLPSTVWPGLLETLRRPHVDVSVHVYPRDNRLAVNELERRATALAAELLVARRRGERRFEENYTQDIQDAHGLSAAVQRGENRVVTLTITVAVYGSSVQELDTRCREVVGDLALRGVTALECILDQLSALLATLPLGRNRLPRPEAFRNVDLQGAACVLPVYTGDLRHPGGVWAGDDLTTGAPVMLNPFVGPPTLTNPHLLVLGTSGAGKSVSLAILSCRLAATGVRVVIIDPEGEYSRLVAQAGGMNVSIRPGSGEVVNPLDVYPDADGRVDLLGAKAATISVVSCLVGRELSGVEMNALEVALDAVYGELGLASDLRVTPGASSSGGEVVVVERREMPTLSHLVRALETAGDKDLAAALRPFTSGKVQGLFDGQSTVDLRSAPLVALDLSGLESNVMRAQAMAMLLNTLWNSVTHGGGRKAIVLDEAWMLLNKGVTAGVVESLVRRGRKRDAMLLLASQTTDEFTVSEAGRAVCNNVSSVLLLRQEGTQLRALQELYGLSDGEVKVLGAARAGVGILRAGGRVAPVQLIPTSEERAVLTSAFNWKGG